MLDPDDLATVPLWADAYGSVSADAPGASPSILRYQAVRRLIDWMASDLVETLLARLADQGIDSLAAVRAVKPRLVEFSPPMTTRQGELKTFLYDRLYTHHRVTRMTQKADRIMSALFDVYMQEPRQLPPHVLRRVREDGETVPRVVADYIAGMTDRFALEEYKKLFDPYERV
jgi:dGTPase